MSNPTSPLIATYKAQEDALHFPAFDRDIAWKLGCALVEQYKKTGKQFAMAIYEGDLLVFSYVCPERGENETNWARRKSAMVQHCGYSSIRFAQEIEDAGTSLEELNLDRARYADSGGSFPIYVEGKGVVAAVAVSGLPSEVDHQFLVDTLTEFLPTIS